MTIESKIIEVKPTKKASTSKDVLPTTTGEQVSPDTSNEETQPVAADTLSPVLADNELRKKELFDLVVERSGMKKKDVKPVVEAMLAVLGDAWAEQREMNLPPLGKFKVQRGKELPDGRMLVLKLRQKTAQLNNAAKISIPEE